MARGKKVYGRDDRDDVLGVGTGDYLVYRHDDTIYGRAGNDIIASHGGNDIIYGGAGNDILNGMDGNDVVHGGSGSDRVIGGYGHDALYGGTGNDRLGGNSGNDILNGGSGRDLLIGGSGSDTAVFSGTADDYTIRRWTVTLEDGVPRAAYRITGPDGTDDLVEVEYLRFSDGQTFTVEEFLALVENRPTEGDDVVVGTNGADIVHGRGGNDTIAGFAGNDRLFGDAGNDIVNGMHGDDVARGGSGNDRVIGGAGNDVLHGDAGNDHLGGNSGHDRLYGGDGNDTMLGGAGNDFLDGGSGSDTLRGDDGADVLAGGLGNDRLSGGNHNDRLYGGGGNDILFGNAGNDILAGGFGDDHLSGGGGNDVLWGGGGNDTLVGWFGNDELRGGAGFDTARMTGSITEYIFGAQDGSAWVTVTRVANREQDALAGVERLAFDDQLVLIGNGKANAMTGGADDDHISSFGGDDVIDGRAGNDRILAGSGDDRVTGGAGNDTILAGSGDDILVGGAGHDTLSGGEGSDTVVLAGRRTEYSIVETGAGYRVTDHVAGRDGVDTLVGVEFVRFAGEGGMKMAAADFMDEVEARRATNGGAGNDILPGTNRNDEIFGRGGDDTIIVSAGNDRIDGGHGHDVFRVKGPVGAYEVDFDRASGEYLIFDRRGATGTDRLKRVEQIEFGDGTTVDLSPDAGKIATFRVADGGRTLRATSSHDRIVDGKGDDVILAGDGNDTIFLRNGGNDFVDPGAGRDRIIIDGDPRGFVIGPPGGAGTAPGAGSPVFKGAGGTGDGSISVTVTNGEVSRNIDLDPEDSIFFKVGDTGNVIITADPNAAYDLAITSNISGANISTTTFNNHIILQDPSQIAVVDSSAEPGRNQRNLIEGPGRTILTGDIDDYLFDYDPDTNRFFLIDVSSGQTTTLDGVRKVGFGYDGSQIEPGESIQRFGDAVLNLDYDPNAGIAGNRVQYALNPFGPFGTRVIRGTNDGESYSLLGGNYDIQARGGDDFAYWIRTRPQPRGNFSFDGGSGENVFLTSFSMADSVIRPFDPNEGTRNLNLGGPDDLRISNVQHYTFDWQSLTDGVGEIDVDFTAVDLGGDILVRAAGLGPNTYNFHGLANYDATYIGGRGEDVTNIFNLDNMRSSNAIIVGGEGADNRFTPTSGTISKFLIGLNEQGNLVLEDGPANPEQDFSIEVVRGDLGPISFRDGTGQISFTSGTYGNGTRQFDALIEYGSDRFADMHIGDGNIAIIDSIEGSQWYHLGEGDKLVVWKGGFEDTVSASTDNTVVQLPGTARDYFVTGNARGARRPFFEISENGDNLPGFNNLTLINVDQAIFAGDPTGQVYRIDAGVGDAAFTPVDQALPENVINGDNRDNTITGDQHAQIINGRGGNDRLTSGGGNDILDGGPGNDWLLGDLGRNILIGGPGADLLSSGPGAINQGYTPSLPTAVWVQRGNPADPNNPEWVMIVPDYSIDFLRGVDSYVAGFIVVPVALLQTYIAGNDFGIRNLWFDILAPRGGVNGLAAGETKLSVSDLPEGVMIRDIDAAREFLSGTDAEFAARFVTMPDLSPTQASGPEAPDHVEAPVDVVAEYRVMTGDAELAAQFGEQLRAALSAPADHARQSLHVTTEGGNDRTVGVQTHTGTDDRPGDPAAPAGTDENGRTLAALDLLDLGDPGAAPNATPDAGRDYAMITPPDLDELVVDSRLTPDV